MRNDSEPVFEFDEFRFDRSGPLLYRNRERVDLTPKALKILEVFLEAPGRVVSKEEIVERVWPDTFVDEANLPHHIFFLRQALDNQNRSRYIQTVPKRGYMFISDVRSVSDNGHSSNGKTELKKISSDEAPTRSASRSGKLWIGIGGVGVAVLIVTAFVFFGTSAYEPEPVVSGGAEIQFLQITDSGKVGAATISPDGKFAAYSQNYYDGRGVLYLRQIETGQEIELTPPERRIFGDKAFSPDNNFVYFYAVDPSHPQGAILRVPVIGGRAEIAVTNTASAFALSPDGSKVAFFRTDPERKGRRLTIVDLKSGHEDRVFHSADASLLVFDHMAWSPDETTITFAGSPNIETVDALARNKHLYGLELATGKLTKIGDESWNFIGAIRWMPDGKGLLIIGLRTEIRNQVFFVSYPEGLAKRITREMSSYGNYGLGVTSDGSMLVLDAWDISAQLWSLPIDGDVSKAERLTNGRSDGPRGITSMPDGDLFYTARSSNGLSLFRFVHSEGRSEKIAIESGDLGDVVAAPDGSYIVYARSVGEQRQLFRAEASGRNPMQLTSESSVASYPEFSPDGRYIVYVVQTNGEFFLKKIPAMGGEAEKVGSTGCLAPAFSPDGKYLSCISPAQDRVKDGSILIIDVINGEVVKTFEVVQHSHNYRAARWSPDGKSLYFVKTEASVANLWKIPVTGGEPKKVSNFQTGNIYNFSIVVPEDRFVLSRGEISVDVVLVKNLQQRLQNMFRSSY